MKTSTIIAAALTAAATVTAEPVPAPLPTIVTRDLAAVSSVVAQVSDAMTKLDTSVKAFDGADVSGVQTDSQGLITALTSGAKTLAGATDELSLTDALGLQAVVTPLGPAAETLVKDVSAKKAAFEKAGLCTVVGGAIKDAGSAAKTLVDGVVAQVPEAGQGIAKQVSGSIVDTLTGLVAEFAADKCKDAGSGWAESSMAVSSAEAVTTASAIAESSAAASSYVVVETSSVITETTESSCDVETTAAETVIETMTAVVSTPEAIMTGSVMTVTVTAPCACSESATTTESIEILTPAIPTITSTSTSASISTIGSNSTFIATGALSTTGLPPIVTAGAVAHGVSSGSVGALAAFAALLFV
ncbi:hydrophobic surface binding protein A-domain-containing protein [Hypoxylon crocopeplum]|nr:hydrophobic surface binding protein A-domain-containing protein [Hypoxylon crocopeplum]